VVAEGAELWRTTERQGEPPTSVKEGHFNDSDVAAAFLEEVQRTLTAGGWRSL
jgi:hypothetical protein